MARPKPYFQSPEWAPFRQSILARDPVCMIRDVCQGAPSDCVDHIVDPAAGGAPFDPSNARGACWPCHMARTPAGLRDLVNKAIEAALSTLPGGTSYSLAIAVSRQGRSHSASMSGGDLAEGLTLSLAEEGGREEDLAPDVEWRDSRAAVPTETHRSDGRAEGGSVTDQQVADAISAGRPVRVTRWRDLAEWPGGDGYMRRKLTGPWRYLIEVEQKDDTSGSTDRSMLRPLLERVPTHVRNALLNAGLSTTGRVTALTRKQLLTVRNLGATGVDRIEAALADEGLSLKPPVGQFLPADAARRPRSGQKSSPAVENLKSPGAL